MGRKLGMKTTQITHFQPFGLRHTLKEYIYVIALMFSVLKRTLKSV